MIDPPVTRCKVSKIPKEIKVGAHVYKIRLVAGLEEEGVKANGMLDSDACEILLLRSLTHTKMQEILLHETLHAIFYAIPNKSNILEEEEFVTHASPHLLQVLQENPKLVEYLSTKSSFL